MSPFWMMAAADLGRAFQRHSRRGGSWTDAAWFVLFVLMAAGFFLLLHFWDRIKATVTGGSGGRRSLFDELCRIHRLSDSERSMLKKIAEQNSVAQPAVVFVDRSLIARYSKSRGAPKKTCAALIRKLFGDD